MKFFLHQHDLPADVTFPKGVAVDTETMGLRLNRDRLCLVQLSGGDGICHLVQLSPEDLLPCQEAAPHLKAVLKDPSVLKLFHFARFDMAALSRWLGVMPNPVYCTKIASKLTRTYTDRHGLKDLCRELLDVDLSKQAQCSDWGNSRLATEQLQYAASDVAYLHDLREKLNAMLQRENRLALAEACFQFLSNRVEFDFFCGEEYDIFSH